MSDPGRPLAASSPTRFLLSRGLDIGFLMLGGATLSAILVTSRHLDFHFLYIALTFAIVMDFPHVVHTYVRVAFDPDERQIYRREFYISLAVITAVSLSLVAAQQFWLLVTIWVYWQPYHVIKQHDGIAGLYAVKNGYKGDRRWLRGALMFGCVAPILFRIMDTGLGFGTYEVFGHPLPFSNLRIPTPPIPWPLVALAYLAALICIAQVVRQQLRQEAPPWPSLALVGTAILTYNIAYLAFTDLYTMVLTATAAHALQYHAICWLFLNGKHGRAGTEKPAAPLGLRFLRTVTAPGNLAIYAGSLLLMGALIAGTEFLMLGTLPLILVLHHFFMDGIIWKSRRNPQIGSHLGLRPLATSS